MSKNENSEVIEGRLTEWLLRGFALLIMGILVLRWGQAWLEDQSRWTVLLLLISESYTLGLILIARRAIQRDLSPLAILVTVYAVCYAALLDPHNVIKLAPEWLGSVLLALSMVWHFSAKVVLGRSFGLLPAQRGLVMTGPYRLIRHPIYFGYLIGHIGMLLVNFSEQNALIITALYLAQVIRIQREESILVKNDSGYADYQQRVRWRLIPFIY